MENSVQENVNLVFSPSSQVPPNKVATSLNSMAFGDASRAEQVEDQFEVVSGGHLLNAPGPFLLVPPVHGLRPSENHLTPTISSLDLSVAGIEPPKGFATADGQEEVKLRVDEGLKRVFGPESAITIHESITTGLNSLFCCRISVNGKDYHVKTFEINDSFARESFRRGNAHCKDFSDLNVGAAFIGEDIEAGLRVTKYIPGEDLTEAAISMPPSRGQAIKILRDIHEGKQTQVLVHFNSERAEAVIENLKQSALQSATTAQHKGDIVRAFNLAQYAVRGLSDHSYFETLCHLDPYCKNFRNDGTRLWLLDPDCAAYDDGMKDLALMALEMSYSIHHLTPVIEEYGDKADIKIVQLYLAFYQGRTYLDRHLGRPWHVVEEKESKLVAYRALVNKSLQYYKL